VGARLKNNRPKSDNALGQRMRNQRRRKSMTLQQLAEKSGVSIGYLSQVERGNATPTLGTLSQIAAALNVSADYFIATPRTVDSLTCAGKRPRFSVDGSALEYEQIGADHPDLELTSVILHVPPGYTSEVVSHVGEEIIYVLDGEICQRVDGRDYLMRPGDSLHYLGTHPHSWSNQTKNPARIMWVGRMHYDQSSHVPAREDRVANSKAKQNA
jgi:transcriptional regulator with XRE-family HTH domain